MKKAAEELYHSIPAEESINILDSFLLDKERDKCLSKLEPWINRINLFKILKSSTHELKHSNILAWLLDPIGNHGAGDYFLRKLFEKLYQEEQGDISNTNASKKLKQLKWLTMDLSSFSVEREWRNIDILLHSSEHEIVIAIENKIKSKEHDQQLDRYQEILSSNLSSFKDFQKYYIYLTPQKAKPSNSNWRPWNYNWVKEAIQELLQNKTDLNPTVATLLDNYLDTLENEVMENQELKKLCQSIYEKYKKFFDLMYEQGVFSSKDTITFEIEEVFKQYENEKKLTRCPNVAGGPAFHTPQMDAFLGSRTDGNGSWGNCANSNYCFYYDKRERCFRFEIGNDKGQFDAKRNMQLLFDKLRKGKKEKITTYNRLWKSTSLGEDEQNVKNWAKKTLEELLKQQAEWITQKDDK